MYYLQTWLGLVIFFDANGSHSLFVKYAYATIPSSAARVIVMKNAGPVINRTLEK